MPRLLTSAVLGGALLALCLPKPGLCPLAWCAISPLLFFLPRAKSYPRAAWAGWLFGFAFWGTAFYWVFSTCRFAGAPRPAAFFAWAAMCGLFSFSWALFGAGALWAERRFPLPLWPWACAALWAAEEFLCDRFFPYAGALPLGYTQWRYPSWIQGSSWAGPHGLGFLIMLANGALSSAIRAHLEQTDRGRRKYLALTGRLAAGSCLIWWGLGFWALSGRPSSVSPENLRRVAIIQPNVDQYRKWNEHSAQEIRSGIAELVESASRERPALVLWPESSVPGRLDETPNGEWVSGLSRRAGVHQLVGTVSRLSGKQFNSAVLFGPQGDVVGRYNKRQLVPFGEFVPWRSLTSRFLGILDQLGDMDAGPRDQPLLPSPLGKIGVTICYEAVFPRWNRQDAAAGAEVLANLTNDGWYKDTWGPYQHFYVNVFRAVENRRPVLRAANTGISGVIDPYGVVLARSELGRRGTLAAWAPLGAFPDGSFYARRGDWFGWLCLASSLALFGAGIRRRRAAVVSSSG